MPISHHPTKAFYSELLATQRHSNITQQAHECNMHLVHKLYIQTDTARVNTASMSITTHQHYYLYDLKMFIILQLASVLSQTRS